MQDTISTVATEQPYSLPSVILNLVFIKDTKPFSTLSTNRVGRLTTPRVLWGAAGRSPAFTVLCNIYVVPAGEWSGSAKRAVTACLLSVFL